jgi:hypothetical protein
MIDTVTHVIDTVRITSDYGIDLINKVDSFYESAWSKLIFSASTAFAIIGIIVPVVIQFYQNKALKANEAELKRDFLNMSSELKNELQQFISEKFESERKEMNIKLGELNAKFKGSVFHLQGTDQFSKGNYDEATKNFIIASRSYVICKDYVNLQQLLYAIADDCLLHFDKKTFDNFKIVNDFDLEEFIKYLYEANENGSISIHIQNLKNKSLKLK